MIIEAFRHYGLLKQWESLYQDKVNIISELGTYIPTLWYHSCELSPLFLEARRVSAVLNSRMKALIKDRDDRPALHLKMKETFKEWSFVTCLRLRLTFNIGGTTLTRSFSLGPNICKTELF